MDLKERIAELINEHSASFADGKRLVIVDDLAEAIAGGLGLDEEWLVRSLDPIPSTHVPICEINRKHYYYMCKNDIIKVLSSNSRKIIGFKERKGD